MQGINYCENLDSQSCEGRGEKELGDTTQRGHTSCKINNYHDRTAPGNAANARRSIEHDHLDALEKMVGTSTTAKKTWLGKDAAT